MITLLKSTRPNKKFMVKIENECIVHFGAPEGSLNKVMLQDMKIIQCIKMMNENLDIFQDIKREKIGINLEFAQQAFGVDGYYGINLLLNNQ
jgi:hypothetical protein